MRATLFACVVLVACGTDDRGGVPTVDTDGALDAALSTDGGPPTSVLPAFCADYPPADTAGTAMSTRVRYGADGMLVYTRDADGHRLPDVGHAGYHGGARELPDVPEVTRISAGEGDDTARIQAALDAVAVRPLDEHGHRGAVVLAPGVYDVAGTVRVRASGVVLRGSGDGADPAVDTILRAPGDTPHQRSVVVLGAGSGVRWREALPKTQAAITTPRVLVGEASFEVDRPERFAVGDRVVVRHPSTAAWIAALDGGGASVAWTPGDLDIPYLRRVVAKEGTRITLDVPVHNHLDRALAQSVVYSVDDAMLVREAGVERLRVDIVTAGGEDENHAWNAVEVGGAEDAWVRDVTALHFGYAGVSVHDSFRITVREVHALDGVAQVTGGRLYHFSADGFAQEVLFDRCEATQARHAFVANGTSSVSGIVFLRGRGIRSRTSSEGHRRWSQALVYDSIVEETPATGRVVGLYNRGDWGTQHGWAAAHSVLWRYDTGGREAVLQQPPTAQNFAIATMGRVTADGPFDGPPGYVEAVNGTLVPASLYEAQVCDRLRRTSE
jgi:hypothetical protein